MSIRVKLLVFLFMFLSIVGLFSFGSLHVFNRLSESLDLLNSASNIHMKNEELKQAILNYSNLIKDWAFTGDKKYLSRYERTLAEVYKSFGSLEELLSHESLTKVGREFEKLKGIGESILSYDEPKGNPEVFYLLRDFDSVEVDLLAAIEELGTQSINNLSKVSKDTEKLKLHLTSYLSILLGITLFSTLFLILLITRSISLPFRQILRMTDSLMSDKPTDAFMVIRKDEFGILANRFYKVYNKLRSSEEDLKRKLAEIEMLYEISKIASTTLDLQESLRLITTTVAQKMEIDYMGIYLFNVNNQKFYLNASNKRDIFKESFSMSQGDLCSRVVSTLKMCIKEKPSAEEIPFINEPVASVMLMPIIKEGTCAGVLVFVSKESDRISEYERNIANVLSNTITTILTNSELYHSTLKQLKKISVLYELSEAITTVVELDELLYKVAKEVTDLFNAKGCVIRLKEDGILKVKASFGLPEGFAEKMEVRIGETIAGKVAESGAPLLVEDVSQMPPEMRVPLLKVKSVVCVPIKIGNEIIGTIGLYDKMDEKGNLVSFDYDDMTTAEGIAYITSLAIEKARLFEQHVKKEKEALEAKKRLDLLFETVQTGIVSLDREYRILSYNNYIREFLHLEDEDITGKNALNIFHEKGGICPHCVAKLTFETGDMNIITQSKGANYAELSSYPVRDEEGNVIEAVVLIRDITDRVLYQEEILSLYKEVAQTKDYLESLIDNSADAIVTTDLNGIVKSWNKGAERIYGFTEDEVKGKFLPFIPDFLLETEMQYIERIKKGETIKDIETLRKRKDGTIIEVSLTLSPIKDASGEVIGISGISRDISEKKRVEKELVRRNQELSRLFFISSAMRGTLELDRLLRMVLTAVTMSDGLGFNRALLFLVDEERNVLKGQMGVGPSSAEEAWQIWQQLSLEKKTLPEIMKEIEESPLRKDSFLDRLCTGIEIDLTNGNRAMIKAVKEKKSIIVHDAKNNPIADPEIIQQLGSETYAIVPLIVRDRVIGVIWVDNYFNRKPITEEDMRFLTGFSNQVASAIESARLFEQVKLAEAELENIFESISDLLYITTEDYTIRNINKAVVEKVGLSKDEIIGRKCYEVFHGMDKPYEQCPHHKTVETKRAHIEEFEDPYRGGTFLTSTSPLFDSSGKFLGTVHIVRDISELKKLREKLAQAERMAALGEVAAKVAHEIRNPLVSIGGFSRRLEKKLDGKLKEYASIITREVNRLEVILKEILSFVKEARIHRQEVDVASIINDIISLYSQEIKQKGINVEIETTEVLKINVDPNRIKEALINIISNAIQALDKEGRLCIKTYKTADYGVIEISDNGPGIKDNDLPYIFDPFFTTKIEGTGLGLAITHRIVEEHNGKIEVESHEGEGTTFKVYLPLITT
jgi:PAS domain S-box-containing protein